MRNIDFLPAEYREQRARRQAVMWRGLVVALFCILVVLGSTLQVVQKSRVAEKLRVTRERFAQVEAQRQRLENMRVDLADAQSKARLFTFLRHRWSPTQIFAAVLKELPESVKLNALELRRETIKRPKNEFTAKPSRKNAEAPVLPPLEDTLAKLQGEHQQQQFVIRLTGTAERATELHSLLGRLGRLPQFAQPRLVSLEAEGTSGQSTFEARIVVRSAYDLGQEQAGRGWPEFQAAEKGPPTG